MTEPLRPMSTGQVLDRTFTLYRKNFWLFVGIATVGPAANVIFQLLTVGANIGTPFSPGRPVANPSNLAVFGLSMLFGYIILLVGMAISHAATVKAVAAVYLGLRISIVGAYKALRGRILSLFGTGILILLIMAAALLAVTLLMIPVVFVIGLFGKASAGVGAAIVGAVAVFLIVIGVFAAMIMVYARYALAIQACIVEALGPVASLKRSSFLTKGSRWRAIAIYGVFLLLSMVLGGGLGAVAGAIGVLVHNKIVAAVLVYLAGFIAGSVTGPLATIGLSLLYYDERVRKEAFDLQLMLSSLDAPPAAMAFPAQV